MAPTTPGSSRLRQRELRVAEHSEGAQGQGSPFSSNTDRNSIDLWESDWPEISVTMFTDPS